MRVAHWMSARGLDADRLGRRALAGVFIGLAVVAADRIMGLPL
jgi:hypothetical protein